MKQYKDFSGYILAGGKSSRMGTDKAFLYINGKTFVQNAVEILSPVCGKRVKVVLNKEQTHSIEKLPDNLPYVFDIYENRGPVGGIHAALRDSSTEYTLILPVDLPSLTIDFVQRLTNKALETGANAVIPKLKSGKTQQLCTIFKTKQSLPLLEKLLSDQSKSISVLSFINQLSNSETLLINKDASLFDNINSRNDYEKINQ